MEENAEPLCIGQNQVKEIFLGQTRSSKLKKKVRLIRDRLQAAQSRQKSYADNRRRNLTFEVGDNVYLKVSPLRGTRRFKVKGKLAPRYIGSFPIIAKRGEVAYQLELPENLSEVHNVFHVSQLKKCLRVPEEQTPVEAIALQQDLTYPEHPIKILDVIEKRTRRQTIRLCKVQWSHHSAKEATWEREDQLK